MLSKYWSLFVVGEDVEYVNEERLSLALPALTDLDDPWGD